MKRICIFFLLLPAIPHGFSQTTIWSETFAGYTNCTTTGLNTNTSNPAADWTTTYTDCDDAVTCTPNQSYWGVFNGEFRINDIEGGPCTCGTGGTTENFITTEVINISGYSNVSFSVDVRYTGTQEASALGVCDNSGDLVHITYSLDGGPFVQAGTNGFLTDDFMPNPITASQNCLNGSTLIIRIQGGNKANDENFYIDNIFVKGFAGGNFQADAGPDDTICPGGSANLLASGGGTYTWQTSPDLSCTNCANPVASPPATESFVVTVNQNGCFDSDTVTVHVQNIPINLSLGNDTLICGGPVNMVLDATTPGATYVWQDATTNATFTVSTAGTYYVQVTNACAVASDTLVVTLGNVPVINLGADTAVCPGATGPLYNATYAGATYLWQDGSTNATYQVNNPGTYHVILTNSCGSASDTAIVYALPLPVVNLGNDTLICTGPVNLTLQATQVFPSTYSWQDGTTNSTYTVNAPGTYSVTVTNVCGNSSDMILINQSANVQVNLGVDQVLCNSSSYLLDATTNFATSYLWQDNSTSPQFNASLPGIYFVTVTSACGSGSDTIELFAPQPIQEVFSDIEAGCGQDSVTLSLAGVYNGISVLWSNGDSTLTTTFTQNGNEYVTILYCGTQYTDSFHIVLKTGPGDVLYMPDAFTPNGNELNEKYSIGGIFTNTLSFSARIFDRWGMEIYSSNDPNFAWDGSYRNQPAPVGVYYLVIEMERECEQPRTLKQGTAIHLLR